MGTDPPVANTARSLSFRALVALMLLAGFYLPGLLLLAALVAVAVALALSHNSLWIGVLSLSIIVAIALLRSLVLLVQARGFMPGDMALEVDRDAEPTLWAFVDDIADTLHTRTPDRLFLVPDVTAAVVEVGGLRQRPRTMLIGCGLLEVLTVEELRAVLTHEFGHYVAGDALLGGITYRGHVAIERTIQGLADQPALRRIYAGYGAMYQRITMAVRRQQELAADALAVRIAGRDALTTALQQVHAGDAAFRMFIEQYVDPAWELALRPDNLYDGFRAFLADPHRQVELAALRHDFAARSVRRFDSHPPLGERIRAAALVSDCAAAPDRRPARALLSAADELEAAVTARACAHVLGGRGAQVVDWHDVGSRAYVPALLRRGTAAVEKVGSLDDLIAAAASPQWHELAAALAAAASPSGQEAMPTDSHRHAVLVEALRTAVIAAFLTQALATLRWSWATSRQLVSADGTAIDVSAWVRDVPGSVDAAETLRRRLRHRGVALDWCSAVVSGAERRKRRPPRRRPAARRSHRNLHPR
ncbi:MAG: M48 family metallopeptidase [Actinomycetes bacterium]